MALLNVKSPVAASNREVTAANSGRFAKSRSEVLHAQENFATSAWLRPEAHRAAVGAIVDHGMAGHPALTDWYSKTAEPMPRQRIAALSLFTRAQTGRV